MREVVCSLLLGLFGIGDNEGLPRSVVGRRLDEVAVDAASYAIGEYARPVQVVADQRYALAVGRHISVGDDHQHARYAVRVGKPDRPPQRLPQTCAPSSVTSSSLLIISTRRPPFRRCSRPPACSSTDADPSPDHRS